MALRTMSGGARMVVSVPESPRPRLWSVKYKVTHRHHEGPAPAGQLAPPAGGRRGRHDGGRGHLAPRGRQDKVKNILKWRDIFISNKQ